MMTFPFYLKYSQIAHSGILAGLEYRCTHGVDSVREARNLLEKLIAAQPEVTFRNPRVVDNQKGLVANLLVANDAIAVDYPEDRF